jgi:phosphoethanolamine N-methyltransferase
MVFSKDSIVHIPDKHALMRDVFRVLKPGGWFVASDWLIGHDHEPSPEMKAYIASEGLDFGMASPLRYADAMRTAGFEKVETRSRNAWYRDRAREELTLMKGPLYAEAAAKLGRDFVDHNIESGGTCFRSGTTHPRGSRKPSFKESLRTLFGMVSKG